MAHRFDQYTNPFMLARNISSVFQPGIENAQRQQGLGIEQARQNLAATAQNTLLPLQANMLNAQAGAISSEGALRNFQLNQMQTGTGQLGDLASALARAKAPEDVPSIVWQYPNAMMTSAGQNLVDMTYKNLSQKQTVQNQFKYQSAFNTGAASAYDIPAGSSLSDAIAKIPKPDNNDPDATTQYAAQVDGLTKTYSGQQQAQLVASLKLASTQMQNEGKVDAALLGSLRTALGTGRISPSILAAADTDPATAAKIQAALTSEPDSSGQVVPDKTAVANLNIARSILNNPTPSTVEKNWAYSVMNNNGTPAFQLPIYPPAVQDKIDTLNSQISALQSTLPSRSKSSPWMGLSSDPSPWDQTNNQIVQLQNQALQLKNQYAPAPPPDQGQPAQGGAPAAAPAQGGFGYNRFNPQGVGRQAAPVVPGNPMTTAALQQTQGASAGGPAPAGGAGQAAQPAAPVQIPTLSADQIATLPPQLQSVWKAITTNPAQYKNDPSLPGVIQMILARIQNQPKVAPQTASR